MVIRKLNVLSTKQGTCLYNGTFPTCPLRLTYLHPKPCHAFRWLMLYGSNHHQHRREEGGILPELTAVSRWGFPPLAWHACTRMHTEKLKLMPKSSPLKSPPLGTPYSTFHCTERVPFKSRSICRQARNGYGGRGHYVFPCPTKARGSLRYKNNRLAGLGYYFNSLLFRSYRYSDNWWLTCGCTHVKSSFLHAFSPPCM